MNARHLKIVQYNDDDSETVVAEFENVSITHTYYTKNDPTTMAAKNGEIVAQMKVFDDHPIVIASDIRIDGRLLEPPSDEYGYWIIEV